MIRRIWSKHWYRIIGWVGILIIAIIIAVPAFANNVDDVPLPPVGSLKSQCELSAEDATKTAIRSGLLPLTALIVTGVEDYDKVWILANEDASIMEFITIKGDCVVDITLVKE